MAAPASTCRRLSGAYRRAMLPIIVFASARRLKSALKLCLLYPTAAKMSRDFGFFHSRTNPLAPRRLMTV